MSDSPETTPMKSAVASGDPAAAKTALMTPVNSESKGEATMANAEVTPNPVTTPRMPTPQRQRRLPMKYKHFVLK